jgi:hypothetical protein
MIVNYTGFIQRNQHSFCPSESIEPFRGGEGLYYEERRALGSHIDRVFMGGGFFLEPSAQPIFSLSSGLTPNL